MHQETVFYDIKDKEAVTRSGSTWRIFTPTWLAWRLIQDVFVKDLLRIQTSSQDFFLTSCQRFLQIIAGNAQGNYTMCPCFIAFLNSIGNNNIIVFHSFGRLSERQQASSCSHYCQYCPRPRFRFSSTMRELLLELFEMYRSRSAHQNLGPDIDLEIESRSRSRST